MKKGEIEFIIKNAIQSVSLNGFCKIENFFQKDEINKLKNIHSKLFETNQKKYGDMIVEIKNKQIKNIDFIYDNVKTINNNLNKFFDKKFFLNKVWFEKKIFDINTDKDYKKKLPYIPHIDKNRFFKALIYLEKTDEENGSIEFLKINPDESEKFRQKLINDNKLSNEVNNTNSNCFPVKGNAGDLIFFDTNCPHRAGHGLKGRARNIIRMDFEIIDWNRNTLFSKLKFLIKHFIY